MNENHSPTSDAQLDELLRDVPVPQNLECELLSLCDESRQDDVQLKPESRLGWNRLAALLVAACYLLLAGSTWVFWPESRLTPVADSEAAAGLKTSSTNELAPSPIANENEGLPTIQMELELAAIELVEESLVDLEIQRLESRLANIENELLLVENKESVSIVLAVADQTSVNFGGSSQEATSDMANIVAQYPGTTGAEIATKFVNLQNQ